MLLFFFRARRLSPFRTLHLRIRLQMVKVQLESAVGIGLAEGTGNETAWHIVAKVRFVDCAHDATIGQLPKFSHVLAATSDNHLNLGVFV